MYDLIVVGSGPGGSATASYVAQAGHKVLVIEKDVFPRFKIGESLLPYSMEIFKDLGFDKVLENGNYIKKHGALFIDSKNEGQAYFDFSNKGKAKYPFAYEVERSSFDKDLLNHAKDLGAEIHQPELFESCDFHNEYITVKTNLGEYKTRFIVDGSGAASVICNKFGKKEINSHYNNNFAVYTHFEGISRDFQRNEGDITIGILNNQCWSWIIPFHGIKTSVGLVVGKEELSSIGDLEKFFNSKVVDNPWLEKILSTGKMVMDVKVSSNFSRKPNQIVGKNWGSVGDAASFLDPVFSSGVHLALMSAKLLSANIINSLKNPEIGLDAADNINNYNEDLRRGIMRFHNLLQIFYSGDFIDKVKSLESRENLMSMMTKAVSGGMWDEENTLFRTGMM